MLTIIYSFNKRGYEAEYWTREIAAASNREVTFLPFNHGDYVDPVRYIRAQLLDNLYFVRDSGLERMYRAMEDLARNARADALLVDNCAPYHPDYLRRLSLYKVLRLSDGPLSAYDRDIPYLHAYDHVLYHSPAYSRDMDMAEKMAYCGVGRADFWPLALFDAAFDPMQTEESLFALERDIDVVFVGALHVNKMPLLARVKKALGRRCRMYGLASLRKNLYFNAKFGYPGFIRALPFEQYVPLYKRAKIGFNVHNRGDYTVGSYRLFELPGNGVMQLSDGGRFLSAFFDPDSEIVAYADADELVDRIRYYLSHEEERRRIALNGYRRAMRDHRIHRRLHEAACFVRRGMRGTS